MTEKNYPEEIYKDAETGGEHFIPRFRETFEKAYDLGYEHGQQTQGDTLVGWSNLTEAIKAGERIDWERLDGLEAKCVHPELGVLTHKMERDQLCLADDYTGWYKGDFPTGWSEVFFCSWQDCAGWSLWVKGDLPLRKLTADQLALGTCFAARRNKGEHTKSYSYAQLVKADGQKPMVVCYSRYLTGIFATIDPKEVEVIDIYGEGTFEKPKGDA